MKMNVTCLSLSQMQSLWPHFQNHSGYGSDFLQHRLVYDPMKIKLHAKICTSNIVTQSPLWNLWEELTLNIKFEKSCAWLAKSIVRLADVHTRMVSGNAGVRDGQAPDGLLAGRHLPFPAVPGHFRIPDALWSLGIPKSRSCRSGWRSIRTRVSETPLDELEREKPRLEFQMLQFPCPPPPRSNSHGLGCHVCLLFQHLDIRMAVSIWENVGTDMSQKQQHVYSSLGETCQFHVALINSLSKLKRYSTYAEWETSTRSFEVPRVSFRKWCQRCH